MRGRPSEHEFFTRGPDGPIRLRYFEWGEFGAPTVLLVHATGFHARCWDRTVAALPEGLRVVALDLRGHGGSDKRGPFTWDIFGGDLLEFVDGLALEQAIGVGHSMGGHCVTQVAAQRPEVFQRLLLVDPVILDPELYGQTERAQLESAEDHPVARRRNHWSSWEDMYARFEDRAPFSLWQREVLEDYCRYGVAPRHDGDGFELACPPWVEASIYLGNSRSDVHGAIPGITVPVTVLRARPRERDQFDGMDFSASPTWPALAAEFPNGRDVPLPALTHFIPMQAPELVARFIVDPRAQP